MAKLLRAKINKTVRCKVSADCHGVKIKYPTQNVGILSIKFRGEPDSEGKVKEVITRAWELVIDDGGDSLKVKRII